MIDQNLLWIPFTLAGAAGQVSRNAMQRGLTGPLGTLGATHIRFLFGLPFAGIFLAGALVLTGDHLIYPRASFVPWLIVGGLAQIAGTALMLAAMKERSFVVATAYLKTEAIQAAVFGAVFLADHLTALKVLGTLVASLGVILTALKPGGMEGFGNWRPTLYGLFAASFMALSSIGYRGAILSFDGITFATAATITLVVALSMQTILLSAWLMWREPGTMTRIFQLWKASLAAGFLGAFASLFWFLAFALTPAANVRTLALIEVPVAQIAAYYGMKQSITLREVAGVVLILIGVAALIAG